MKMFQIKNQKGVTLTTLTIYIIVSTILLGTLAFININFMSELGKLTKQAKMSNEMLKFYAFFVDDIKSAHGVLEFSDSYVRFDNGVDYSIRYTSNERKSGNQTYEIYEVYRKDALITDKLSGVSFMYQPEDGFLRVKLSAMDDHVLTSNEQFFKVGRGY